MQCIAQTLLAVFASAILKKKRGKTKRARGSEGEKEGGDPFQWNKMIVETKREDVDEHVSVSVRVDVPTLSSMQLKASGGGSRKMVTALKTIYKENKGSPPP